MCMYVQRHNFVYMFVYVLVVHTCVCIYMLIVNVCLSVYVCAHVWMHLHFYACECVYVRYMCIVYMLYYVFACMHQPSCMGILLFVLCV